MSDDEPPIQYDLVMALVFNFVVIGLIAMLLVVALQ